MTAPLDFPLDSEFSKLLEHSSAVDMKLVALEIARDAYPQLDFAHSLEWIAKRGQELVAPAARSRNDRELLMELGRCLSGTHGLHGDREAYLSPEGSYLHRVIETGIGIPISLSLVYAAVGHEAGIPLTGVAAPRHFLIRYDGAAETYFVDAFHQGRVLRYDRCLTWLEEITELSADELEPLLEPASPREIVIRMLNNLKAIHVQQDHWSDAWLVQRRLTALQPTAYDQRRDLALVAVKSNRPGLAVDLLEACLRDCPDDKERRILLQHRQWAEAQLSTLN